MTEKFIFNGAEKKVTGIDENGYGPLIGPLIITGITLILPFDSIYSTERDVLNFPKWINDSKEVFRRSLKSYRIGEYVALNILQMVGYNTQSFHSLLKSISNMVPLDLPDFALPTWNDNSYSINALIFQNTKVESVYLEVFTAERFNSLIETYSNKAFVDFYGFKLVRDKLSADVYMMGKIGGTKEYRRFFDITGEHVETVVEEREISYYKRGEVEMYFLLNGDENYLPIMLASIIGKYVRELYMKAICERFGFFGEIPFASGYRHDPNTEILKQRIMANQMDKYFMRIK